MSEPFRFKQFNVVQEASAMKVGTDGVLLGAWVDLPQPCGSILDAGTGTGLIALMMAQRAPQAIIDAVEIDPAAAAEAKLNFGSSPWSNRLHLHTGNWNDFTDLTPDLIVSNPPFFTETLRSPDAARAVARHVCSLSPLELIRHARSRHLAFIAPASADDEVTFEAAMCHWHIRRKTHVAANPAKQPMRTLWQMSRTEGPTAQERLDIRSSIGEYTTEYLNLVTPFYLWIK